jgi:hypothetical protein
LSEFIGTAITRALLQIEPGGEPPMSALAVQLPDVLHRELKGGLLLFLNVERAVLFRTRTSSIDAGRTVSKIGTTLANVGERLKSIDPRKLANEWLDDFATRSKMFLEFRRNETAQPQIRRILFVDQVAL